MAGSQVRTTTIVKSLQKALKTAKKSEERAERWKKELGNSHIQYITELVKSDSIREVVEQIAEDCSIEMSEIDIYKTEDDKWILGASLQQRGVVNTIHYPSPHERTQ